MGSRRKVLRLVAHSRKQKREWRNAASLSAGRTKWAHSRAEAQFSFKSCVCGQRNLTLQRAGFANASSWRIISVPGPTTNGTKGPDLTRSPSLRQTPAICAFETFEATSPRSSLNVIPFEFTPGSAHNPVHTRDGERFRSFATVTASHLPPHAVAMPRPFRAAEIWRWDFAPAA